MARGAGGNSSQEERTIVEEAISGRDVAARARVGREQAASEQAELEVSRWLVALVALGSVGVLVVFWGLAAWVCTRCSSESAVDGRVLLRCRARSGTPLLSAAPVVQRAGL